MNLSFEYDFEDLMAFQKNYLSTSKQFKRTQLYSRVLIPVLLLVFLFIELSKEQVNTFLVVIIALLAIVWFVFYPKRVYALTIKKIKKMIKEGDSALTYGMHEVHFNEDEIVHIKPNSELKLKWSGVKKFAEDESYYFLYDSGISGIVIPKNKIDVDLTKLDRILKSKIV